MKKKCSQTQICKLIINEQCFMLLKKKEIMHSSFMLSIDTFLFFPKGY